MPPTFSHSRLSSFENCPRRYRYRYIDDLAVAAVGVEAHMGKAVHEALERLYRRLQEGRTASLETVQRWFQQGWEREPVSRLRVVRRGFVTEDYRRLGLHCLEGHYRAAYPFADGESVAMEMRIELFLDAEERYPLLGYIDRVVRARDGAYEIQDYKSSASLPRVRDLDADRQLSLYEIGFRRLRPEVAEVRQVWHYLVFGKRFTRVRRPWELERVVADTLALCKRVEAEREFPACTGILCHWCDFNTACPEGRAYVQGNAPPGLP